MNKSKFLKKSLALLLAFMLVFAMIPLGAAAAVEEPVVTKVLVNDVEATLSGTTYTAEITDPGETGPVDIKVQLKSEIPGSVAYYNYDDLNNASDANLVDGLWTFGLTDGHKAAKSVKFVTVDAANAQRTTYTINYTTVAKSGDTAVKSVTLEGMYDVSKATENGTEVYTVVAPYNMTAGAKPIVITPENAYAAVEGTGIANNEIATWAYNKLYNFTIVAQNGASQNYQVKVVEPKPFSSFSIEGERHTSQISRVTENPNFQVSSTNPAHANLGQVEVYLPFGTATDANNDFYFTPTFKTNYNVEITAKTTDTNNFETTFESGKKYNLRDFFASGNWAVSAGTALDDKIVLLEVKYSDVATEQWLLTFDTIPQDTVPVIKSLSVDNYVAEIDGTTINLALPESVRKDTTKSITLNASEGTKIDVIGTTQTTTTDAQNVGTLSAAASAVPLTKNEYTLKVEAAGAEFDANSVKALRDYTLKITTANVVEPQLNSMHLKKGDTEIKGEIKDGTVTFTVPYSMKAIGNFNDWQLFWTASSGATVTYDNGGTTTAIDKSGALVTAKGYLPAGANATSGRFTGNEATATKSIVVATPEASKEYKVTFKNAPASQVSTLSKVQLAEKGVTKYEDLNSAKTMDVTVSGNTIKGEVFYNKWDAYANVADSGSDGKGATLITTLPTGAKAFYVKNPDTGALTPVDVLNEITKSVTTVLPRSGAIVNYGLPTTGVANHKPLTLVIVSEALAEKVKVFESAGANEFGSLDALKADNSTKGLYTVYDFTLTQKAPRTGNTITALSVYDNYTGTKRNAVINGNEIVLNLPAYFVDSARKSLDDNLYLDFTTNQGGATLKAFNDATDLSEVLTALVYKKDGSLDTDESLLLGWDASGKLKTNSKAFNKIRVEAENGDVRKNDYSLIVKIDEAKKEAKLNSVTIAGATATPVGNKITVNVPFGTEVTSLKPTFNVSENAFVVTGDKAQGSTPYSNIADPGTAYNFYTSRQFTVISEDHNTTNTYTIEVVVSDEFTDVPKTAWYYEEVMKAARLGLVTGKGNGIFAPMENVKRGDFALMIARMDNGGEEKWQEVAKTYTTSAFIDVDSDAYYSAAIAYCKDKGYIDGNSDGTFNAERYIKREEMAKFLCNVAGLKEVTSPSANFADDASISNWAKGFVYAASEAGLMNGVGGNKFAPKSTTPRCQAAAALVRYTESK